VRRDADMTIFLVNFIGFDGNDFSGGSSRPANSSIGKKYGVCMKRLPGDSFSKANPGKNIGRQKSGLWN